MTKDAMLLMHRLVNDESLNGTEIFELYSKTMRDNTVLEKFNILEEMDNLVYDFAFLTQTSTDLGVTRKSINELLSGLCEQVGSDIEISLQDSPIIIDRYPGCPIKTNKVFLSAVSNVEYAKRELLKIEGNKYKLGEMKIDKQDWYNICVFELFEA